MICDTLEHLNRYRGFHENLDTAIDYLTAYCVGHTLADLPLGRTEVAGENVFIHVMEADLKPGERYWWRVRIWDGADRPTSWSDPASFSLTDVRRFLIETEEGSYLRDVNGGTVHWTNRRNKAARLSKPRSKLLLKRLNGMYPDLKLHIVKFSTKPYKI